MLGGETMPLCGRGLPARRDAPGGQPRWCTMNAARSRSSAFPSGARWRAFCWFLDMSDLIIIPHFEAVTPAVQVGAALSDYEAYLFDAPLADLATSAGLRNLNLFTELGGPSFHTLDHDAHAAARNLEAELDLAQREYSGVSIAGWQHLNLYYFFIAIHWYGGLWERLGPKLRQHRLHILVNDNPAEYYFNSFLPSLLLASQQRKMGAPFVAYDYGAKGAPMYSVPDLEGEMHEEAMDHILTHIPTCLYDADYFRDELKALDKKSINLESKYWNVRIEAERQIGLADMQKGFARLPLSIQERIDGSTRVMNEVLSRLLEPHIPDGVYCSRQVDHFVQLYRSQLITYAELRRFFAASPPSQLLLSEHDTGFHGPLISFAEQESLPVILVPHSKVIGDIEFTYDKILTLTHPMQGAAVHDGWGRAVPNRTIAYPERFCSTSVVDRGLQTMYLLLNGLSLNGIPFAPFDVYLTGIRRLVTWCMANQVRVKVRCRPGYTLFTLLNRFLGLDAAEMATIINESMESHVSDCDICLMYDTPTTGANIFLRNSVPVLNPTITRQITVNKAIVHPNVIAMESLDETLQRLDIFKANPLALYDFRRRQFLAYISEFQHARPLRAYIEGDDRRVHGKQRKSRAALTVS